MSSITYGDSDFDVNLMLAVHIVNRYKDDIKTGAIHENNQTVINWVNTAKKVIEDKNK